MNLAQAPHGLVRLPNGRTLDLRRPRSAGPLDSEELAYCRSHNIALAYDPVQIGWLLLTSPDDLELQLEAEERYPPAVRASAWTADRVRCAELETRYNFRPWRVSDLETFVSLLNNPKIWEYLPEQYPAPLTEALARDLIELSNWGEHHEVLAVELDGKIVGQVRLAFNSASSDHSVAEISYWLGEPFWGRGIASDLVTLFTYLSFQQRDTLQRIVARVHQCNAASARVLEKASYRYQGKASDDPSIGVYQVSRGELSRSGKLSPVSRAT